MFAPKSKVVILRKSKSKSKPKLTPRQKVLAAVPEMRVGTIKFYHYQKAYGFLIDNEGKERYFPASAILDARDIARIYPGARVAFAMDLIPARVTKVAASATPKCPHCGKSLHDAEGP